MQKDEENLIWCVPTGYNIDNKTGKSTQKYGIIGYAMTREEGRQILAKYHEQPFDLENADTIFHEVNELWSEEKYENATKSTINGYRAAYNTCTSIFEKRFRDLNMADLQGIIDNCNKNYPTLRKIKILFNQLFAYAMKHDICNKDYSKYIDIAKHSNKNPDKYNRKPFTNKQLDILWSLQDDKYYQLILILIYTGFRIYEFLSLKKKYINIKEHYLNVTKSKTESGIRKVPISDHIYPFIMNWYKSSECDYLLHTDNQEQFKYRNYYDSYSLPLMEQLGFGQTPHCCRHTFISLLAEAKVSPTYTKLIVGHKDAMSLTEKVYTHIDMKHLLEAVNSIYYPKTNE